MKFFTTIFLTVTVFVLFTNKQSYCIELAEKPPIASLSFGAEYSSGSYNSESTIRRTYVPLVVSWYPLARLDLSVELPFIYQNSSLESDVNAITAKSVEKGPGNGSGIHNYLNSNSSTSDTSVSGLGDIILRGGYIFSFEDNLMPQVRTSILVKTPTASTKNGLGTGEFDFGGGLDLSKWIGSMRLAGEAAYNYQGKVANMGLKNYLSYSGTVGYQATKSIQPMLVLNGSTASSDNSDPLLEVRARIFANLNQSTAVDFFASRGISKSSPDYAGGLSMIYSF